MPVFSLPYGKESLTFSLPDYLRVQVIAPKDAPVLPDVPREVSELLRQPLGIVPDWTRAHSVAVVISDKTRPVPLAALSALLDWLAESGITQDTITLLLATGTHPPMTPDEFSKVLPSEILSRYQVISHDCDDPTQLVHLGQTRRGTPVWANRHLMAADLRIVVGNIEPHQFMGFSGGVKSAAVGLAGRATINHNHAMMIDPLADLGQYDDNPARQDVEEIGRLMGIHLALNTILNRQKQIAHVLAGEPVAVMRAGIPLVRDLYEVAVVEPCDLVITSPGGYPKDINLYQAQKALAHGSRIAKTGGAVILVAACSEGTGSAGYDRWIEGKSGHAEVLEQFAREEFRLGPHKAFQIARDAIRLRETVLVSQMSPDLVRRLMLTPAGSVQEALDRILPNLSPRACVGILPAANATVPTLQNEILNG